MNRVKNSTKCLTLLSEILLKENESTTPLVSPEGQLNDDDMRQMSRVAACLTEEELVEIAALADSHHVIMRSFPRLQKMMSLMEIRGGRHGPRTLSRKSASVFITLYRFSIPSVVPWKKPVT